MTPILVVSAAAILGLAVSNLAWSRYAANLRARAQLLQGELKTLKGESDSIPTLRAEVMALTLRIQELTRGISPGRPLPGTLLACLERVEESLEVHRQTNRTVRRQLSRTVDRLRDSQKEIRRLQEMMEGARGEEGGRPVERDPLKVRLQNLQRTLERSGPDDHAHLLHARKELEDLRFQLRGAYRSIAELETRLSTHQPLHPVADGGEATELVLPSMPSEFEIM